MTNKKAGNDEGKGKPQIPWLLQNDKHEHARIEGQVSSESDDPIERKLSGLRREGNRSWAQ
jgi:hypothetical protein